MTRKNKKPEDDRFPEFKEFRSVRYYSNIDGEEKSYGYNYTKDDDGEKYEEIGDPTPLGLGEDMVKRIKSFDNMFKDDFISSTFKNITRMLPGLDQFFEDRQFGVPKLVQSRNDQEQVRNENESRNISYDIQKHDDEIYVICELPGFSKEDVSLKLKGKNQLHLVADNKKKQIETIIPVNYDINKKSKINASMNNGILEVVLKVQEIDEDESDIPIN